MKKIILITTLMVLSQGALAGSTNVDGSMEQLKLNVENSQSNLDQYKKNMDISTQNVVEATKAVKELRAQREQLLKNGQNIDGNKAALTQMSTQINTFKVQEQEKIKAEQAQMAELMAVLEKLEKNQTQRQKNIEAYDNKLAEIEAEKAAWDQQKLTMGEIKQEIDNKEKEALGERAKWLEKKNAYRTEAVKWNQQNKVAEQTYTKYKHLND